MRSEIRWQRRRLTRSGRRLDGGRDRGHDRVLAVARDDVGLPDAVHEPFGAAQRERRREPALAHTRRAAQRQQTLHPQDLRKLRELALAAMKRRQVPRKVVVDRRSRRDRPRPHLDAPRARRQRRFGELGARVSVELQRRRDERERLAVRRLAAAALERADRGNADVRALGEHLLRHSPVYSERPQALAECGRSFHLNHE